MKELGIRWTIGDVSDAGYETLRLSVWGAHNLFGRDSEYVICVNSVPLEIAKQRAPDLPDGVRWVDSNNLLPSFIKDRMDENMAEGVGWKLAPVRIFPSKFELALDNDCILWQIPDAFNQWFDSLAGTVVAEDVKACFGQFEALCNPIAVNIGIRGLPPDYDYELHLRQILEERPVTMTSELDEQGLQTAAIERNSEPFIVGLDEVTICSPFPPHLDSVGSCGVHFVGLNAKSLPWEYEGRPAAEYIQENWLKMRPEVYAAVGVPLLQTA